jgi:hypothetical protein
MSKHPSKVFTLYVNKITEIHELVDEKFANGIPFFRGLKVHGSSFFSHPLIPEFLRIYGSQIDTVYGSKKRGDVVPEEVAFYHDLPNLTQLSTNWLGDDALYVKMPALERLQLLTVPSALSERAEKINFDFLLNFPNLRLLWLSYVKPDDYLEVLSALGPYLAVRNGNGWKGYSRKTLTICVDPHGTFPYELNQTEKEEVAGLLEELAVADGRILIEKMPITLLDEAVLRFQHQPGQLLRRFGKCIRSLIGVSISLYEVELPNMRKLIGHRVLDEIAKDGHFLKTVSWPQLEEIDFRDIKRCKRDIVSYLANIVFGNGVRCSVKRIRCNLELLSLGSNKAHLLLANFPNLTHLKLNFPAQDVGLHRTLMRLLPKSCSKLQFLSLGTYCYIGDEDFMGVYEDGRLSTPPLLKLPGK